MTALDTGALARAFILGDTHGSVGAVRAAVAAAVANGCRLILQLGDFGYWPHTVKGRQFLVEVQQICEDHGVELWWVDGNHENHDELGRQDLGADGSLWLSSNIRYLPRGFRFRLGGRELGALGGAFSIDWRSRIPGESWWSQEVVTAEDVERLGTTPLDVLLTHDMPAGVPVYGSRIPWDDEHRAYQVRMLVAQAVEATSAKLVLHGHWHLRHSYELARVDKEATEASGELSWALTVVEGLACNGMEPENWAVLDLEALVLAPAHIQNVA